MASLNSETTKLLARRKSTKRPTGKRGSNEEEKWEVAEENVHAGCTNSGAVT
jgi:hypothetical protein